ncbi:exonuclease domain-containing protein [Alicyclobacillus fastidiosus]|uniref:3'-5' exonuclease DinG n=1 Tax=Alicyclobacillus fastidiosus TaxID=392011 RepID=A0ABY6ZC52_9BACL|nr:helicase C-terminal domain-containing protein [Alicyclobacillus fastidiosus]WAH39680.1 exonuclease domain-containing protein [Alicyclobacillus fastidiosus]
MNYVVFDIETTGLDPSNHEIIEVGAVRIRDGAIADTFHHLVRPRQSIPEEISRLTGIDDGMVADAESADEILPKLLQFIGDDTLVAHNLSFDAPFLQHKLDDLGYTLLRPDGLCTLVLARALFPTLSGHRLENVAEHLGIVPETAHRALADAMTTAKVFLAITERASSLPLMLVQQLAQLSGLFSPRTGDWFTDLSLQVMSTRADAIPDDCEVREGMLYTSVKPREEGAKPGERVVGDIQEQALQMLAAGGPLSESLPGYEPREGQLQMVAKVSEALTADKHAVIEAGTGTGKSMAYLIPAALHALASDERVVVSTHTLALQDQIEQRDFPTLVKLFGGQISLAVQKGRKNYVCLRKVRAEAGVMSFSSHADEIQGMMGLLVWLTQTAEGVREELSSHAVSHALWSRVQSETDTCINKRCPFFRPCYYFRAKARAQTAEIVVTNHSLLLSDLKADHRVLPKYEALVIDEAHHLEDQATKHLGDEVHAAQLAALSYRLSRDRGKNGIIPELKSRFETSQSMPLSMEDKLTRAQEWIEDVSRSADTAFALLGGLLPAGKNELRLTDDLWRHPNFIQFSEQMSELRAPIHALRELVKGLQEWAKKAMSDDDAGRIIDAAGFLDQWLQGVELLEEMTVPSDSRVTWIERRGYGRPRYSVHTAPIDVSSTLRTLLFEPLASTVLTSATLSVRGRFDFTINQLGLGESLAEKRLITGNVPSPFDYQSQARLFVPNDVPELAKMTADEAATWLCDSLYHLAVASSGRVLALFTSHQMLRETAKLLRGPLAAKNLSVFAQDVDGGRTAMLEAFRNNPNSILLGAQSFWEGIDLPGDQLTTLVIIRLPFAPPSHPVTEARHERLTKSGQSPFWVASLPEAVVRFRQGFGRLIRTKQDKGVVVVYDKRIITAKYGATFIQSLAGIRPHVAPEQEVLRQVRSFLSQSATS